MGRRKKQKLSTKDILELTFQAIAAIASLILALKS